MAVTETKSGVFLEVRNVTLTYPLPAHMAMQETSVGGRIRQNGRKKELVALDSISFRLEAGDSLGLIGHNGSGKTTLLKILAGILQPTTGTVSHKGALDNALNTKIGFRPEATGRHNIRLKAILAGRKSKDLPDIIADVEDFAELGPFLDMPMHTYSAGMRARLAFGIATAFHHDVLILDEWLGAGDKAMQDKAAERMRGFVNRAAITVIASHSGGLLSKVCSHGLVLRHGKPEFWGTIEDAICFNDELYLNGKGA